MCEPAPHLACVITRFHANPEGFLVAAPYMCDVPSRGTGERLTQMCGRIIIPEIQEDGARGIVIDSFSPRCALAAGTVVIIETIDTSNTWYLGNGSLTAE